MWSLAIVAEKAFEESQYPFVMLKKNPLKTGNQRDLSQSDKEQLLKTYRLNTPLLNLGTSQNTALTISIQC